MLQRASRRNLKTMGPPLVLGQENFTIGSPSAGRLAEWASAKLKEAKWPSSKREGERERKFAAVNGNAISLVVGVVIEVVVVLVVVV